jgi:hypothetical protein
LTPQSSIAVSMTSHCSKAAVPVAPQVECSKMQEF